MVSANRHGPLMERHQYDTKVGENLPAGQPVATVKATDPDTGSYGQLSYSIPSQISLQTFSINNVTGTTQTNFKRNYGQYI